MASIMDRDPWTWTITDVVAFFTNRHARAAVAEMPGVNLPPPDQFTAKFSDEGVTGSVLLLCVDDDFLRRRCKIATLGPRAAIIHCINKLRAISRGYKSHLEPTVWPAPSQDGEAIQLDEDLLEKHIVKLFVPGGRLVQLLATQQAPTPPAPAAAQVQTVGEPMQLDEVQPTPANAATDIATIDQARPNESLVEAKDGKKRRRLDLSALSNQITSISQAFSPDDIELSLPARKLPIDDIFFGDTKIGNECGPMKIDHPLYVHEGSDIKALDEKNFQYVNTDLHLGVARYVGARLQRSMYLQDQTLLERHERAAVARYPYRPGLQAERTKEATQYGRRGRIMFGGTRSAMVFQWRAGTNMSNGDGEHLEDLYVATRENETILTSGADKYNFDQADLSGEHEHLLLKYREDENDLMSETDPETEEGAQVPDEDTSTEFGDDLAEEDDEEEVVAETEVKTIIDRVLNEYIAKWKETKLPNLEEKKAWTVWKQTKHSKFIRDQLVQGARTRIEQLQFRLLTARKEFEGTSWEGKDSVENSCKNLEVTVEDIEQERWKIDVWGRRREPDHVSARKAKNKHAANLTTDFQHHNQLPFLGSQDRLSVSPKPRSPTPPPPMDSNDRNSDVDREQFHTPQGSPVLHPDDPHFVVQDDDDMQIDEPAQATAGAEMDEDLPEPAADFEHPHSDHSEHHDSPSRPRKTDLLKTPTAAARFEDLTSADMPSPSTLAQRRSVKASPAASVIDMTEIPSSPFSPTTPAQLKATAKKAGATRKRGRPVIHDSSDEVVSTSEADQWHYSDLVDQENREKLLQKLLRDMGQKNRDDLWRTYQELGHQKFMQRLQVAIDTITSPRDETPSEDDHKETPQKASDPKNEILKKCARLLLAFYFIRPEIFRKGGSLPTDILAKDPKELPTPNDMYSFVQLLRRFLMQRGLPLYSSPMPASFENPIVIGTDDDLDSDNIKDVTPRSTRKRKKTNLDVEAENKRKAARARLEESQQQQSSNPSVLRSMVLAESNPGDKIINPLRKANQQPIFIEANIASKMKSYQLEGVQFLWRELTSDPDDAQGCLLAHTMGLGKTMQSIALLRCVDTASQSPVESIASQLPRDLQLGAERNKRSLRFLIICPSSLLQNWRRELESWVHPNAFGGNVLSIETTAANSDFMAKLQNWAKYGGVLLVGYPIFQKIVKRQDEEVAEEDQSDASKVAEVQASNENAALARKIITEDAELVVADEAHHVKNPKTSTAIAASKIITNARIALTGTPMSNDVDEIYALISWVSPGFLGDKSHFSDYFGVPIKNGLYMDSTTYEKRRSTIKLKSLHHEIEPKVHRAGISVLKGELKPKVEFVITVELTEAQREAYAATVAALLGAKDLNLTALTSIFAWLGVLGLLTAHPHCFRQKLLTPVPPKDQAKRAGKANASRRSVSTTVARAQEAGTPLVQTEAARSNEGSPEVPGDESVYALGFTEAIVNALVEGLTDNIDPALSAKTRLLQRILQLSKQCDDKVLIFSASIPSLDYLGTLLRKDGVCFGRIDGSIKMEDRTKLLARFQSEQEELDVLLISTRAGGQGLNIQSANRVIIFDFGFNPSWEEQAIGRAYRFGQRKPVFVYRFVAGGTFESNIYNTQMFKTSLAQRVVDKKNPHRNAIRNTKEYLYPPKHVTPEDLSNELAIDLDPNVLSPIMEAQIERGAAKDPSIDICSVRTMEVLQAEDQEAPLDPEELKQVEEFRATWKAERLSGSRPSAMDPSLYRPMGAPSSTAPVPAGPSAPRTMSMPSSTQAPAWPTPPMHQPLTQVQHPGTTFGPRDIRNGSGMGPPRTSTMGGLPFAGPRM